MGLSNRVVDFLFHPDSHLTATNKGIFGTAQRSEMETET